MITYEFLQHYWWFIISFLGALLVFMMFVQGGQGLLYTLGKEKSERDMIVNSLGRKWGLTFTTLVTFGASLFASFPVFYATSFGGAFYVWMLILFVFIIQAVAYEYRDKPNNFLGGKTYNAFLMINGLLGTLLIGVAVGTFFTGANFTVDKGNLLNFGGDTIISQWASPWRGLEAVLNYRNVSLGLAVLFLSRVLGLQYLNRMIDHKPINDRAKRHLLYNAVPFVVFFLVFLISILLGSGWEVDPATGVVSIVKYKYFFNLIEMPVVGILLLVGVVSVLAAIAMGLFKEKSQNAIWFSGVGTVLTVLALLLMAGWNNTSFYPSLVDTQSSLTVYNSSSSYYTLKVMSVVSLFIPVVIAYIWYSWRQLTKQRLTLKEIMGDDSY